GWSRAELGAFFTLLSLALIVTQALVLPWLGRWLTEPVLCGVGGAVLTAGYALMAVGGGAVAHVAGALYGGGNGLMWPAFLTLYSEAAPEAMRGAVQGLGSSAGSLAAIAGTLGGGVLFGSAGARTFLVPTAITVATTLLCLTLGRPRAGGPAREP